MPGGWRTGPLYLHPTGEGTHGVASCRMHRGSVGVLVRVGGGAIAMAAADASPAARLSRSVRLSTTADSPCGSPAAASDGTADQHTATQGPTNYGQPASSSPQPSVYGPQPHYQAMPPQDAFDRAANCRAGNRSRPAAGRSGCRSAEPAGSISTANRQRRLYFCPHEQAAALIRRWPPGKSGVGRSRCSNVSSLGSHSVGSWPSVRSQASRVWWKPARSSSSRPTKDFFASSNPRRASIGCATDSRFPVRLCHQEGERVSPSARFAGQGHCRRAHAVPVRQQPAKLNERYFLRLITPAQVQQQQVWLEAYPRLSERRRRIHQG